MGDDKDPRIVRRARDFYSIYCASSDGKNYQGLPCPAWDALTEAVRGHWYTVALRSLQIEGQLVIDGSGRERFHEPDASVLGHLPNQQHALEVWRSYSGAA